MIVFRLQVGCRDRDERHERVVRVPFSVEVVRVPFSVEECHQASPSTAARRTNANPRDRSSAAINGTAQDRADGASGTADAVPAHPNTARPGKSGSQSGSQQSQWSGGTGPSPSNISAA
jgi:hypothetical protein